MSVCGTVPYNLTLEIISWHHDSYPLRITVVLLAFTTHLRERICLLSSSARTLGPGIPSPGRASPHASSHRNCKRYGNINPFPIGYAFQPRLRGRLTLGRLPLPRNPLASGERVFHPSFRYSCLHPLFRYLQSPSPEPLHQHTECSPTITYTKKYMQSAASVANLSPVTF